MADWITTTEAAELSGYNVQYIRWLIRDGRVRAEKKGNSYWVSRKSLLAYIRAASESSDRRHGPKSKDTA
jgi:excisionase family DNA binding protein